MTSFEKFAAALVLHLGVEPAEVTAAANIIDDLGADSLDTVEITMMAEEMFNIEIGDADAEAAQTVGQWVEMIDRMVSARHPATTIAE